jgi:hypothetical protein
MAPAVGYASDRASQAGGSGPSQPTALASQQASLQSTGSEQAPALWLRVVPQALLWTVPFIGSVRRGVPIGFKFRGRTVRCVLGEVCEYEVLEEVFVDQVYALTLPANPRTVVDLGSNVGLSASTSWCSIRTPGCSWSSQTRRSSSDSTATWAASAA